MDLPLILSHVCHHSFLKGIQFLLGDRVLEGHLHDGMKEHEVIVDFFGGKLIPQKKGGNVEEPDRLGFSREEMRLSPDVGSMMPGSVGEEGGGGDDFPGN